MLKIGITGGIGSGKTTVCKVFELYGIPVFYADQEAKLLMVKDEILIQAVKETFGEESYFVGNVLNNKYIANIVFNNEAELAKLNAIVHPAVFRAFDRWIAEQPTNVQFVLKEAALLFESGSDKMCDQTILVLSPEEMRIKNVMERDNVSREQVKARMDKQFSDEDKIPLATHILYNNNQQSVIEQVQTLHNLFLSQK